jgi:hypothetical protein
MINIISSFYIPQPFHNGIFERITELKDALNYNIQNDIVEKIHLYIDNEEAHEYIKNLNSDKINVIEVGKKPLYSDLFGYAFNNLQDKICMVTNSDIYIKECDLNVLNKLNDGNIVYALSRYEWDMSCPQIKYYGASHDCFIFKAPLNNDFLQHVQHVQHHWNSERVVMYELDKIGAKIYNPCYQIKIVHLHKSGIREPNRKTVQCSKFFGAIPCTL